IYPLLKGVSKNEREIAAPSVLIENTKGTFAGGRWVLINQTVTETFWSEKGAETLKELASFIKPGVTDMWLKTNYAAYEKGERAKITAQLQALKTMRASWNLTFTVSKDGEAVYADTATIDKTGQM